MKEGRNIRNVLLVLIGTSLVFAVLYRRFLIGNLIYLYSDTGSDSIAASYPILSMLSYLFQNRQFSYYTLFSGLGQDTTATFLQFINPLKAFMLFFDKDSMPTAIMIQLYLQTVVSGMAFYGYIRRYMRFDAAAVLSSVIWPFVSFTMLWSQNLSYGTAVCMFMVAVFLIEELLDRLSLRAFLLLSLMLAVFICSNYYFTYMTGIFTILYIPVRSILKKVKFLDFLKGYFLTALSAVFALFISAAAAAAIAANFLQSARTGDVIKLRNFIPGIIRPSFAVAALARLFSENTLGIGNEYVGPTNYYEIAAIFTSALFLFAFFYFLWKKGIRIQLILITLFGVACIMHPLARYILDLSSLCMRFGFMICFLECVLIAYFLDDLMSGRRYVEENETARPRKLDKTALLFSIIVTVLITAGSFVGLYLIKDRFGLTLSIRTILFSAGWTLIFAVFLFFVRQRKIPAKLLPLAVFSLIAGEILIMHHDVLYLRLYLTKDSFSNSFFSSGTEEAVRAIEFQDRDLYRIATVTDPDLSNEGQVLHFNGMSLRNNTNPQPLIDLEKVHGTNERYTPYFLTGYPQYFQFALLSGKYIVTDETNGSLDSFENQLFRRIRTYENPLPGVDKVVYENAAALPFGYLYTKQVGAEAYKDTDLIDRMHLLTSAWFYTDPADEENDPYSSVTPVSELSVDEGSTGLRGDDRTIDLIKEAEFYDAHNLEIEETKNGLKLTATGEDPYIFVKLPESFKPEDCSAFLSVRETKKKRKNYTLEYFYLKDGNSNPDPAFSARMYLSPEYPESLILLPEGISGFRFDFDDDTESAVIGAMDLIVCENPYSHLEALRETSIHDISFENDTYKSTVQSDGGVLCIPLLYSGNWHASVNGEEVPVMNINGGLCGIRLKRGTSEVRMSYVEPHFKTAVRISMVSVVLWIGLFVWSFIRKRRDEFEFEQI